MNLWTRHPTLLTLVILLSDMKLPQCVTSSAKGEDSDWAKDCDEDEGPNWASEGSVSPTKKTGGVNGINDKKESLKFSLYTLGNLSWFILMCNWHTDRIAATQFAQDDQLISAAHLRKRMEIS